MRRVLLVWPLILGLPFTTYTEWNLGISHPFKNHILHLETEIHLFLSKWKDLPFLFFAAKNIFFRASSRAAILMPDRTLARSRCWATIKAS